MALNYEDIRFALEKSDEEFKEALIDYKHESARRYNVFTQPENLKVWGKIKDFREFYSSFKECYKWNSFSYTPMLKEAYDQILSKDLYYKWNVPIQKIEGCIREINGGGLLYIPQNLGVLLSVLTLESHIEYYFSQKLARLMANLSQFKNEFHGDSIARNKNEFDVLKMLGNYERRKKYNKKAEQSDFDKMLDDLIGNRKDLMQMAGLESTEDDRKNADTKWKNGKPEQLFLRLLFNVSLPAPQSKDHESYVAFFPLLQLLLKDKAVGRFTLHTEAEFDAKEDAYRDYKTYQKSRVQRILSL